jgi:hypothetical protein
MKYRQRVYGRLILKLFIVGIILSCFSSCDFLKKKFTPGQPDAGTVEVKTKVESDSVHTALPVRKASDSVRRAIAEKKAFEKALTDSLMNIGANDGNVSMQEVEYFIIAGSFSNLENATESARKYTGKGFKANVLKSGNNSGSGQYLVSVRSFKVYEQASAFIKETRTIFPGAWIYTKK